MIGRVGQWRSALSAASATRSVAGHGAAFAQRTKSASSTVGVAVRRASSSNAKPLGLKEGVDALGMSPTTRVLAAYITVGMAAMFSIARFKSRDEDEEEVECAALPSLQELLLVLMNVCSTTRALACTTWPSVQWSRTGGSLSCWATRRSLSW